MAPLEAPLEKVQRQDSRALLRARKAALRPAPAKPAPPLELLARFPGASPLGGLALSEQGIVATGAWDGTVTLFDLAGWQSLGSLRAPKALVALAAFSRAGEAILALAAAKNVQLRESGGDRKVLDTVRHESAVNGIDVHRGMLACACDSGELLAWDAERCTCVSKMACARAELTCCSFLEAELAAAGLDGRLSVWDLRAPRRSQLLEGTDLAYCLARQGTELAMGTGDGLVTAWDVRSWRQLWRLDVRQELQSTRACPRSLAMCGELTAVGCEEGELLLTEKGGKAWRLLQQQDVVSALAWGGGLEWAPTADFLACASLDGSWSCLSGKALKYES